MYVKSERSDAAELDERGSVSLAKWLISRVIRTNPRALMSYLFDEFDLSPSRHRVFC
jgi:hypothetical protein